MHKQKRGILPKARPKNRERKKAVKPLAVLQIREIQAHVKRLPDSELRGLLEAAEPGMPKEIYAASLPQLEKRLAGLQIFLGFHLSAGLERHVKSDCVQIESIRRQIKKLKKNRQQQ